MAKEKNDFDPSLFPDSESAKDFDSIMAQGKKESENPQGSFIAEILQAELQRSSSSDRLQIFYELKILNGEYKDRCIRKYDGLGTAQQAGITQTQLKRLGVNMANMTREKLPATLLELIGRKVKIKAKETGQYYNIHFTSLVTGESGSSSSKNKL